MTVSQKTREDVANAIYAQLCSEIQSMSMMEKLAAKKAYEARKPLAETPANVQARIHRITTVVLSKVLG